MPVKTMGKTLGDLLKHEDNKNYNREVVTLLTGTNYQIGHVVGKVTASGKYKPSTDAGADGAQVAGGVVIAAADATAGDVAAGLAVVRGPIILSSAELVFDASVNDATKRAAKIAQLAAIGIVVRDAA